MSESTLDQSGAGAACFPSGFDAPFRVLLPKMLPK